MFPAVRIDSLFRRLAFGKSLAEGCSAEGCSAEGINQFEKYLNSWPAFSNWNKSVMGWSFCALI